MAEGGGASGSPARLSLAARPIKDFFHNPEAIYLEDGVGYVNDSELIAAARANRILALERFSLAR